MKDIDEIYDYIRFLKTEQKPKKPIMNMNMN